MSVLQNRFYNNEASQDVWWDPQGGNDVFDGSTEAQSVLTYTRAKTLAAALLPTADDPVAIRSNVTFTLEGFSDSLADDTFLIAPFLQLKNTAQDTTILTPGIGCTVDIKALVHQGTNGIGVTLDSVFFVDLRIPSIAISGVGGTGIYTTGSILSINSLDTQLINSTEYGIRNTATAGSSSSVLTVNGGIITASSGSGVAVSQEGTSPCSIRGNHNITGAGKSLDVTGGCLFSDGNSISGDVTVASGAVLKSDATVLESGNITNNGTIIGDIGTKTYGDKEFQDDVVIKGNLDVQGTTTSVYTTNMNVSDAYITQNQGYKTTVAATAGNVYVTTPTNTTDSVTSGTFTPGAASVSNPTVITDGMGTFSPSDIIMIDATSSTNNDGIYEVLSHSGTTLTIKGIGGTSTADDFAQTQFNSGTDTCTITKVGVVVLRAGTDGILEQGTGNTSPLTYSDITNFDVTAVHVDIANEISGVTEKTTLVSEDVVLIEDSEDSNNKKRASLGNILDTTPVQEDDVLSGTENNYALNDLNSADVLRVTLSGGDVDLTGIVAPSPSENKILLIENADTSDILKIQHNDGGSTAANRFLCPDNSEFQVTRNSAVSISYDPTSSRWRLVSAPQ